MLRFPIDIDAWLCNNINMERNELHQAFQQSISNAIESGIDSMTISRIEILREWFTNPEFKSALEDYSFQNTMGVA